MGAVCLVALRIPMAGRETATAKNPIDTVGLILLIIGVGCLQLMLDEGKDKDWFASGYIVILGVSRSWGWCSLWRGSSPKSIPWSTSRCSGTVTSPWAQSASASGSCFISPGCHDAHDAPDAARLYLHVGRALPRAHRDFPGLPLAAHRAVRAAHRHAGHRHHELSGFLGGLLPAHPVLAGRRFRLRPLAAGRTGDRRGHVLHAAYEHHHFGLDAKDIANASSLSNCTRVLAGSIGSSLATTMWERQEALHHVRLTESINPFNPAAQHGLNQLTQMGLSPEQAKVWVANEITRQGFLLGFNELFWLASIAFIGLAGLVWLSTPINKKIR